MNEIFRQKKEIRNRIETQRRNLAQVTVESLSSKIISYLTALKSYQTAQTIHCYVSWRNEVSTHTFIQSSLKIGKRMVVPVTDLKNAVLRHSELKHFEDLEPGTFGILEPAKEKMHPVQIADIDLVIIPGVAFDNSGHRLGFGGGYYDSFLAKTKVPKIALAYEFQTVEKLPIRPEDEKVDILITEKKVYCFTRE